MTCRFFLFTGNGFYKYLPIASTHQSKKGMIDCIYGKQSLNKVKECKDYLNRSKFCMENRIVRFIFYS